MQALEKADHEASGYRKTKQVELDRLELDLKTHEEKARQLNIQLNTVKTNKQYAAIQHEIAAHTADASLIEDQLLGFLEEMDRSAAERAAGAEKLQAERRNLEATARHVKRQTAELDAQTARLRAERESKVRHVPPELRALYQKLHARHVGSAMVRATRLDADERACSGCYMRLTSNTINRLLAGNELVRCHSCGRILYIDDGEGEET